MIASLNEAVAFLRKEALAKPEIADQVQLRTPGISEQQARSLGETLPLIPKSYVVVARAVALDGMAIGYFSLSPATRGADLVETLAATNGNATNPFGARLLRDGLLQVGSVDGDPLLLGTVQSPGFRDGEVVLLSHDVQDFPLRSIARSFEQLIVLATNLEDVALNAPAEDAETQFSRIVSTLEDNPERKEWWRRYAAMVLG